MLVLSSIVFIIGSGVGTGAGYGLGLLVNEYERQNGVRVIPASVGQVVLYGLRGLLMQLEVPR